MAYISDNFVRSNGVIDGKWGPIFPNTAETMLNALSGGILVNGNGYGPISAGGGDAYSLWTGTVFGNNQWAYSTLRAIAPATAVLSITAVSGSGSTWTYTYTVSGGSVANAISGGALYAIITGMQNAGNNGHFTATVFGAGTFTVTNASGIAESGSTGTGNCPSDTGVGVMVRGTSNGLNGYFYAIGNNSFGGDGRVAQHELWKLVNGLGTLLAAASAADITLPLIGETILLVAVGTTLIAYRNGLKLFSVTDTDLVSGTPGITSWSMNGSQEYVFANWTTVVNPPGNNGASANNFQAADFVNTNVPFLDVFIAGGNPDLHAYNTNWVENSGAFGIQINGEVSMTAQVSGNALASWQGTTFNSNQFAQITAQSSISGATCGVAVRVASSANTGYFYRTGASNTRVLFKVVNGTFTSLGTSNTTHTNVAGDTYRLVVIGTSIYCYLNGVLENFGVITDSSIASGFPGLQSGAQSASSSGSVFMAGNVGISGNAGIANASLALTGAASASATADSNGNYSFLSLADGSYTVVPSLVGYTFSPASISWILVGGTIYPTGLNFTAFSGTPQLGSVISCAPRTEPFTWEVIYTYLLDAGATASNPSGIGEALVIVGPNQLIQQWSSPVSTIVIPSSPGTVNQVQLSCPPIVRWATFGIGTFGGTNGFPSYFFS